MDAEMIALAKAFSSGSGSGSDGLGLPVPADGDAGKVPVVQDDLTYALKEMSGGGNSQFKHHSTVTLTESAAAVTVDLPAEFSELLIEFGQRSGGKYLAVTTDESTPGTEANVTCVFGAEASVSKSVIWYNIKMINATYSRSYRIKAHVIRDANVGYLSYAGVTYADGNGAGIAYIFGDRISGADYTQLTIFLNSNAAGLIFNAGVTLDIYYK